MTIDPKQTWKWTAIGIAGVFVFTQFFEVDISPRFKTNSVSGNKTTTQTAANSENAVTANQSVTEKVVLSPEGVTIPAQWGDLGKQMITAGVIDAEKLEELYAQRGGLSDEERALLYNENNGNLKIDADNSRFVLNLLWALGLGNKNPILDEGTIQSPQYGGAERFAATGGWSLAVGNSMDHYSAYNFVVLTPEQQVLVEEVSKNIYRPCCNNPTSFPDCNHGMAMLGLLELLASQDATEAEMYKVALQVNSYWFPDTYLTLANYFQERDVDWADVDAKTVLGPTYSSASGYGQIRGQVQPVTSSGGGGCGV